MTTFRFSLQKVLDWRKTELELAEMRFKQAMTALAELDRARAEW
jgi:flagellar biosynthesis chaperone FliJ